MQLLSTCRWGRIFKRAHRPALSFFWKTWPFIQASKWELKHSRNLLPIVRAGFLLDTYRWTRSPAGPRMAQLLLETLRCRQRRETVPTGDSRDREAGRCECGGCHRNGIAGGFTVRGGDGTFLPFPTHVHVCACVCVGSLLLAKITWLCRVSPWPWYVTLNQLSAVSLVFPAACLLLSRCNSPAETHSRFGSGNERWSSVVFRKFKEQSLCSSLAKCDVMRCLAPVSRFWLPGEALAAPAGR